MASISVKVCGNQYSHSGFVPLLLLNSPSFAVEDQFYVGFDNCSYFFSMKVEPAQTVYKLIKNNVKSYGASRAGSLVISFSIPKGYKLDGGYTPYDVLTQLKEEFLKCCMTCKDPSKESYEYKQGLVDQHIFDEKIKNFTILPAIIPHRVMNQSGSIGYIVRPESDIKKFFQDTGYPELKSYKEVIVAESVNYSDYTPITNIQIPRPKVYTLLVDGEQREQRYSDIDYSIKVSSGDSRDPYYNHKEVSFTIRDLLENKTLPQKGIDLDSAEEKIIVDTKSWRTEKQRTISVQISPSKYDVEDIYKLLQVSGPKGKIELKKEDSSFTFTLTGSQISYIQNHQIEVYFEKKENYLVEKSDIFQDKLLITVKEKQINMGGSGGLIGGQGSTSNPHITSSLPAIDIKIVLDDYISLNESKSVPIKVFSRSGGSNSVIIKSITEVDLTKTNNQYVGHLFIPKDYNGNNYYIGFETSKNQYVSSKSISFNQKDQELCISSFVKQPKSLFQRIPGIVVACVILLLTFLIGGVTGYVAHDSLNRMFITKDSIPTNPEEDPHISSVNDANRISKEDADSFLRKVRFEFKSKEDVSFVDIDEYFKFYSENEDLISTVDRESFNSKICNQIRDYHSLKDAIVTGDIDKLRGYIECYERNDLQIWPQHALIISSLLENKANIDRFNADYASVKSFVDLKKYIDSTTTSSSIDSAPQKFKCDKCDYQAANSNDLQAHKREMHTRYTCPECPNGNMWFNSERELKEHMKRKHER